MCGISGLCGFGGRSLENATNAVHLMNVHMQDRGPDAEGIWNAEDEAVLLGHRRLAIMDLSPEGRQPFHSRSGRFAIAYNGEIYNHEELGEKLIREGYVTGFRTTCDTEILIEAIEAYGLKETLQMSKGMFAIAVYDKKNHILQLARDRVGQKPLYYGRIHTTALGEQNQVLAFASDIGALKEIPGFANEIRTDVLNLYFQYGYIPAPYTIYEDIYKLEQGTILTFQLPYALEQGLPEVETFWSMQDAAVYGQSHLFTGSRQEAADELESRLKSAIKDMMIADVPLGAFLSAGIDSATIVSLMQAVNPGKVNTYTIGMEGKYDEAPIAAEIARHLGVSNTQMYITEEDARNVIPGLPRMFGEPFADSSQIPTYLVSKLTKQHVTVSLSGDAGDELFCGYRSYESLERIWGKIQGVPYGLRAAAGNLLLHTPLTRNEIRHNQAELLKAKGPLDLTRIQDRVEAGIGAIARDSATLPCKASVLQDGTLAEPLHLAMLRDLTMYHPDDILVKVDRTAMAVSLETRVPFLDRDVMEFAWSLPIDYLREITANGQGATAGNFTGKLVLRDILYRYVPRELMERPKKGFSIPIRRWLSETDLKDWAEELLNDQKIREQGFLNEAETRRIWNDLQEQGRWRPQIWYILMFQAWLRDNQ